MKKNSLEEIIFFDNKRICKKMKLTVLFMFFVLCSAIGGNTFSQEAMVSLKISNGTLRTVFDRIEQKTEYVFAVSPGAAQKVSRSVSVDVRDKSVTDVLQTVLADTGLSYKIIGRQIVVYAGGEGAQQPPSRPQRIRGIVLDQDGAPLPHVTIRVKNGTEGILSEANGEFDFQLKKYYPDLVLEFSFVGFERRELAVKNDDYIRLTLKEKVTAFDDVVVTGYFAKSKESFTGSVTQIDRAEIEKYGGVNILSVLTQIDPSFKMKENNDMGSDPNKLPDFFIRGEGSFLDGSSLPTFIVDGYEVSLQYIFDMDVERIERLSILKDASATIHYGSRAANGVVVIETRRPEPGQLRVSYRNQTSVAVPDLSDYNLMNAREKLEFERLSGVYTSEDPKEQYRLEKVYNSIVTDIDRGVETYWLSQPLRNAVSHSHSMYVSGGDKKVTYGLSGNFDSRAGVMKKSQRINYGLGFDLTYRISDKISIQNKLSYRTTRSNNSPYGVFSYYAAANPYSPTDVAGFEQHGTYRHYNYLYDALLERKDETIAESLVNNFSFDYSFFKNFRWKGTATFSKNTSNAEIYKSPLSSEFMPYDPARRGSYSVSNGRSVSYDISSTLNHHLIKGKHILYSGVGINIQETNVRGNSYIVTGFLDERFSDIRFALQYAEGRKPESTNNINRLAGFMGNLNYSFANRYFMDLSTRADGSSKYGANKRFGTFWSLGLGWNIHREKFMKDITWLEELRMRGSMGLTGNQSFASSMAKTIYQYYTDDFYYQALGARFIQYGNVNLEWQKGFQRNVGIDFRTPERRLSVKFDYYDNKTQGLLLPVTVPPSLGFTGYIENLGEQRNRGFEVNANAVLVRSKELDVAVFASATHNRNRIVKISNALEQTNRDLNSDTTKFIRPVSLYEEGESLTAIKAVRSLGIDPETGKELYLARDGSVTDVWNYQDKVKLGDTSPLIFGNFGGNVEYKQFSLNYTFRYSLGSQLYNHTLAMRVEGVNPYVNADRRALEERWKNPGDHTFYKNIADRSISKASSRFVQDNNFLELTNIMLSYRFSRDKIKKMGLSNLRMALNMNEVFYLSTVKRERGLAYPYARQFTFTLNLQF